MSIYIMSATKVILRIGVVGQGCYMMVIFRLNQGTNEWMNQFFTLSLNQSLNQLIKISQNSPEWKVFQVPSFTIGRWMKLWVWLCATGRVCVGRLEGEVMSVAVCINAVIIIIIIILLVTFMQGIHNYVPEENHVSGYIVLQLFCIYNFCYM